MKYPKVERKRCAICRHMIYHFLVEHPSASQRHGAGLRKNQWVCMGEHIKPFAPPDPPKWLAQIRREDKAKEKLKQTQFMSEILKYISVQQARKLVKVHGKNMLLVEYEYNPDGLRRRWYIVNKADRTRLARVPSSIQSALTLSILKAETKSEGPTRKFYQIVTV